MKTETRRGPKTETVRARIEPELKEEVEPMLNALGLSLSEAITLFFHQIVLHHGLPFEVKIPNKVTRKVLDDADKGKNLREYENAEEMFKKLKLKRRKNV